MHPPAPGTTGVSALPLGYDFSQVRLHADARAADSARAVNALAYTVGSDIVFGAGQYAPGTAAGKRLLAHELTHAVQQGSKPAALQRQPAPNVMPPTVRDSRGVVRDTIYSFNAHAVYFSEQVPINQALFELLINDWYRMVVIQERTIDNDLGADVALKTELRAAYTAAIRTLISRAAIIFGKSENDLYRENSGRIPMWAWPTPHHLEPRILWAWQTPRLLEPGISTLPSISTPIAEGRVVDLATGGVNFSIKGFDVTIAPDTIDPNTTKPAFTRYAFDWGDIPPFTWQKQGDERIVRSFTGPGTPTLRIQTLYRPGVSAATESGYGRSTTPEDIAGGQVTPRSISLGFHEGSHGLDFIEFLETNPPPKFTGKVGMTVARFKAAVAQWNKDVRAYERRMEEFTIRRTHCVGITSDVFLQAAPEQRIVLECSPGP
jgi:hypothetical protein